MKKKRPVVHKIALPGCSHSQVELKLEEDGMWDDGDRLASLKFPSDGIDVTLYLMESDCYILGQFLIKYASENGYKGR